MSPSGDPPMGGSGSVYGSFVEWGYHPEVVWLRGALQRSNLELEEMRKLYRETRAEVDRQRADANSAGCCLAERDKEVSDARASRDRWMAEAKVQSRRAGDLAKLIEVAQSGAKNEKCRADHNFAVYVRSGDEAYKLRSERDQVKDLAAFEQDRADRLFATTQKYALEVAALCGERDRLAGEVSSLRCDRAAEMERADNNLAGWQRVAARVNELLPERDRLREQVADLSKTRNHLNETIQRYAAEVADLLVIVTEPAEEPEVEDLRREVEMLQARCREHEAARDRQARAYDENRATIGRLCAERDKARSDLAAVKGAAVTMARAVRDDSDRKSVDAQKLLDVLGGGGA